jgi:hypothetical protein
MISNLTITKKKKNTTWVRKCIATYKTIRNNTLHYKSTINTLSSSPKCIYNNRIMYQSDYFTFDNGLRAIYQGKLFY